MENHIRTFILIYIKDLTNKIRRDGIGDYPVDIDLRSGSIFIKLPSDIILYINPLWNWEEDANCNFLKSTIVESWYENEYTKMWKTHKIPFIPTWNVFNDYYVYRDSIVKFINEEFLDKEENSKE